MKERTPGWTRLRQGLKDHEGLVENFIRVLAVDKEQGVYAGTFDGGVFRSGDGGKTWHKIDAPKAEEKSANAEPTIAECASGKVLMTGKDILATGADTVWGTDITPKFAYPQKKQ